MKVGQLDALVRWLIQERNYYLNPGPYLDSQYYVQCEAKADMLEEVLDHVDREWRSKQES